tara:strand:+ start:1349 stop:3109 length:1761 start_codon:yes stop_codon:yes gene_type:complete
MAIDNATQNLKNNNESGLDRRLLLPSVEAQQAQSSQSSGQLLFRSLNELTVTLADKNDMIIDQLVELNATVKKGGLGGGSKENILQTLLATPGRAVKKVTDTGRSALRAGTDLLMSPLNLVRGAAASVGRGVSAIPRGIGNAVGNLFQNKSLTAIADINRKTLDETTAIKESNEDIAVKVEEIAKMMEQEFKIRRRGRLDALEAERDERNERDGLIGGSALAGAAGGAGGDGGDGGSGFLDILLKSFGITAGGGLGLGVTRFGRGLLSKMNPMNLFRSKPVAPGPGNLNVPNPATKATGGGLASRFPVARGLGAAGVALSSVLGMADQDYQDAGYSAIDRGGLGLIEGTLGLGDMITNMNNSALNLINPFSDDFFSTNANSAGMFKDFATSDLGKKIFQFTYSSNRPDQAKVMDKTYFSKEEATAAAEKANINDYVVKPIEVDIGEQGVSAVVPAFKIEKVDQKVRRMMDINISPESSALSGSPAFNRIFNARDRAQELTESTGMEFGVEKVINPQPFDDSVIGFEVKRKESIAPFLDAGMGNQGVNMTVAPMTDNRTSSVVNNNSTVLNKVPLSSVDQSNKVVPI